MSFKTALHYPKKCNWIEKLLKSYYQNFNNDDNELRGILVKNIMGEVSERVYIKKRKEKRRETGRR